MLSLQLNDTASTNLIQKYEKLVDNYVINIKLVLLSSPSKVPTQHNLVIKNYTYDENKTPENAPLMTARNPSHAANLASTDIPYSDKF